MGVQNVCEHPPDRRGIFLFSARTRGSKSMSSGNGRARFNMLSAQQRANFRTACRQMIRLTEGTAAPVIFGPPPRIGGEVNSATACVLRLRSGCFVVTAAHVLTGYEERVDSGEELVWQVGRLPFDPLSRVAWRDESTDTVLLALADEEASRVGSSILSPSTGWPPPAPRIGQLLVISGYPKVARVSQSVGSIGSGSVSVILRVTATSDCSVTCQIEQEDLVSFDENPVPDVDIDLGGWSGAPALVVGNLSYPLIGVVCEYQSSWQLLRIGTLESAMVQET